MASTRDPVKSAEELAKIAEEKRKAKYCAFESNEAYVGRGYVLADIT